MKKGLNFSFIWSSQQRIPLFFAQDTWCTNQVIRKRRIVLFPSPLLYFWLWSKISCFDLLIWSKQTHGWRSWDDSRKAHVLCPGFTKVCSSAQWTEKKIPPELWKDLFSHWCKKFTVYFNDASLPYFSQFIWSHVGLQIAVCMYLYVVFLCVCILKFPVLSVCF